MGLGLIVPQLSVTFGLSAPAPVNPTSLRGEINSEAFNEVAFGGEPTVAADYSYFPEPSGTTIEPMPGEANPDMTLIGEPFPSYDGGGCPGTPGMGAGLLLEDGSGLLLEDGSRLLLESLTPALAPAMSPSSFGSSFSSLDNLSPGISRWPAAASPSSPPELPDADPDQTLILADYPPTTPTPPAAMPGMSILDITSLSPPFGI